MHRDRYMTERARELRANENSAERRIWSLLRDRRLAGLKFRRQHVIGQYVADFVCLSARLVIEIDGETHDAEAQVRDARRAEDIERAGFRVIRFWNQFVLTVEVSPRRFWRSFVPTPHAPDPDPLHWSGEGKP